MYIYANAVQLISALWSRFTECPIGLLVQLPHCGTPHSGVRPDQKLQVFEKQSLGLDTDPLLFSHLFIALSITCCSKSDIRCSGA